MTHICLEDERLCPQKQTIVSKVTQIQKVPYNLLKCLGKNPHGFQSARSYMYLYVSRTKYDSGSDLIFVFTQSLKKSDLFQDGWGVQQKNIRPSAGRSQFQILSVAGSISRVKLSMLSGWEGHILSFLSITARLANCGCMRKRADSVFFFLCVSHNSSLGVSWRSTR